MELVQPTPSRFFDGDVGYGSEAMIDLERVTTPEGTEEWAMVKRVGYRVRRLRDLTDVDVIVPARHLQNPDPNAKPPIKRFTTDLTSVPQMLTWLVPKSGLHLPAALVHDGLITEGHKEHDGPDVSPVEADRIFREAMADLGTPLLRRWIVWSAVTLGSVRSLPSKLLAFTMYLGLFVVGALGYFATLDLFDQIEVICWMGDRPWNRELIYGLIAALVVPLIVCLPWALAKLYRAGWVASWTIAVLFHVTLAVASVTIAYQLSEWVVQLVSKQLSTEHTQKVKPKWALIGLAALIGLGVLTWWLCQRNP